MNETLKLGLILLLICAISAVVLAGTNNITAARIEETDRQANDAARKEVFPDASSFKPLDESKLKELISSNPEIIEIYEAYDNSNNLIGYTFKTATGGYGGDVQVITGISASENKITGMKVVSHSETPGLGANSTKEFFQERFINKPVDKELVVVKTSPTKDNEIQALTSATITSNAVTKGVNIAREVYETQLAK